MEIRALTRNDYGAWHPLWQEDKDNETVQKLYKNLGIEVNFGLHMLQTQK